MSETFAVVLADPLIEDTETIQKIADALQTVLNMIPYDGTRLARNAQGVLIENISQFQAEKIVSELVARGVEAGAADAAGLGDNPTIRPVREIAVSDQQLSVQLGYAEMDAIPWGRLDLVSVCLYWKPPQQKIILKKDKSARMFLGAGLAMMTGFVGAAVRQASRAARQSRESVQRVRTIPGEGECYVVDIHVSNPIEILRITSNACSYSYLDDRLQQKSNANLLTVLDDIVQKTDVPLSPMAIELAKGNSLADCKLDNLHLFERYNRWVFLGIAAFGENKEPAT